ncbi:hypothetical protein V1517DRAFT_368674 [Lipomyces orientalis]|uniref:Uncharacterized protein n=1 Tax=Lipomyces orientalis TaxID=1233043 RepID=A0ACC3TJE6_9ASCO
MCERWVEIHIRKYSNVGISTNSRVEGSHGAMKAKKINRRGTELSQQLSVIGSNRNLLRLETRNQVETATLCTAISRIALEIVYAEVMKKIHQEEEGMDEICSCTISNRYLLRCSHQIQSGLPIDIGSIHPRWIVQVALPPVEDPSLASSRKGRPKGARRLPTSAETTQNASDRIEKGIRCRSCNRIGHNRRTYEPLALGIEKSKDDDEGTTVQHDDDSELEAMWDNALSLM